MKDKALAPKEGERKEAPSASVRFTDAVLREFSGSVAGAMQVTEGQKRLIQGYFIMIDRALKTAEEERLRKNAANSDRKYDNPLPVNWNTVNLPDLALDLVHYARMGLDMMQDNMLFAIPYRNTKRNCYDVTLMEGYNGIRYIAEKYALETPAAVTVEVVRDTDRFTALKKSRSNPVEGYEFEITDPFARGEIVGGFAYLEFENSAKNELIILSLKDILKRKPKYAGANFWGGKQREWQNGKQVEVETDGWFEEMVRKTLIREAYSAKHLPRDPGKIDEDYRYRKLREARYAELEAGGAWTEAEKEELDFRDDVSDAQDARSSAAPPPSPSGDVRDAKMPAAPPPSPSGDAEDVRSPEKRKPYVTPVLEFDDEDAGEPEDA